MNARLDAKVLLKNMIDHARLVVLQAVAVATDKTSSNSANNKTPSAPKDHQIASSDLAVLGSLRGAANLTASAADQSSRTQKARSSALRLNGVLHGHSGSKGATSGPRKIRSIKWNENTKGPKLVSALAPDPKKMRMVQTAAKLKSFKSFGRPHAGDFGSAPFNATFGEFGSTGSVGSWGRDGRLTEHPRPMQALGFVEEEASSSDRNATFGNMDGIGKRSAAALGAAMLGQSFSAGVEKGNSLGRTPTALESSLMKKLGRC